MIYFEVCFYVPVVLFVISLNIWDGLFWSLFLCTCGTVCNIIEDLVWFVCFLPVGIVCIIEYVVWFILKFLYMCTCGIVCNIIEYVVLEVACAVDDNSDDSHRTREPPRWESRMCRLACGAASRVDSGTSLGPGWRLSVTLHCGCWVIYTRHATGTELIMSFVDGTHDGFYTRLLLALSVLAVSIPIPD